MFHSDGEQVLHDDLKLAVDMALANTSSESESASGLRQGENNTTANDALQQAIWDKHAYILRFDGGVDAELRRQIVKIICNMFGQDRSMPLIEKLLRDSNPGVRGEAVRAVGQMRGTGHAAVVAKCLGDMDPSVRGTAVDTLARMWECSAAYAEDVITL